MYRVSGTWYSSNKFLIYRLDVEALVSCVLKGCPDAPPFSFAGNTGPDFCLTKHLGQCFHELHVKACVFCARMQWHEELKRVHLAGPGCFLTSPQLVADLLDWKETVFKGEGTHICDIS